jgi:hypothetical protein
MRRLAPLAALLVPPHAAATKQPAVRPTFPEPFPPGRVRGAACLRRHGADFSTGPIDGTPLTASDPGATVGRARFHGQLLRPLCGDPPRGGEAVDAQRRDRLLGVVGQDDVDDGQAYADELDLGHPLAVA